jgi:hypothetical protein
MKTLFILSLTAVMVAATALVADTTGGPLPKELGAYTSWKRVTPKPLRLPDPTALLCAAPAPASVNPHRQYWFNVFVSKPGEQAMAQAKSPHFPAGTTIVKEKLEDKAAVEPELRTVMIKRRKGFDKDAGDWEYLAVDGDGKVTRGRDQTAHCRSCHEKAKGNDYVFRTYLPTPTPKRSTL